MFLLSRLKFCRYCEKQRCFYHITKELFFTRTYHVQVRQAIENQDYILFPFLEVNVLFYKAFSNAVRESASLRNGLHSTISPVTKTRSSDAFTLFTRWLITIIYVFTHLDYSHVTYLEWKLGANGGC